jgi:hypothetical protein
MVMELAKRTYSLPAEVIAQFEATVPPGQRSATISGIVKAWMEQRRLARLREELVEGCREMAAIYREVAADWQEADDELHRSLTD